MKSLGVEDGSVNEDIIRGEEGAVYGLRRVKGKRDGSLARLSDASVRKLISARSFS